jgi:hypothetical protein
MIEGRNRASMMHQQAVIPEGMSFLDFLYRTVRFIRQNLSVIARLIFIPVLLFIAVAGFGIDIYLDVLREFLAKSTDRTASLVLAVPVGGVLLLTFINAAIGCVLSDLALKQVELEDGRPVLRTISNPIWRMFAASLRFWLIACAIFFVFGLLDVLALTGSEKNWSLPFSLGVSALVYFLAFRLCVFIAPLSLRQAGPILRRCWALSGVRQHYVLGFGVLLALIAVAVESCGEALARLFLTPYAETQAQNLADKAAFLQAMLPAWLFGFAMAYVVSAVLFFIGSAFLYHIIAPSE